MWERNILLHTLDI